PGLPCRIGRHRDCEIVLPGWRVARWHASLLERSGTLMVVDKGSLGGTWVNGERVSEYGPLQAHDEIQVAGYRIRIAESDIALDGSVGSSEDDASSRRADAGHGRPERASSLADSVPIGWRRRIHDELLGRLDLRRHEIRHLDREQLKAHVATLLSTLIAEYPELAREGLADALHRSVLDEAIGLGVLEPLLIAPDITEIMVNGTEPVFIERAGRLEQTSYRFSSDDAIRAVIERIVSPIGRRIDDASPMVDARLPDGSRVNAVIPPLALQGPVLTIRRFNARQFGADDLIAMGSASPAMMRFLTWSVEHRRNIVVAGGTGSGKTTLLNLLARHIPGDERIITIEDAAELRLEHRNLVSLEARPVNAEGRGGVAIRDLVRNALRMRPDRIVVGECRGGEAIDMLQAMNTGHEGSLTTVHANSARDALSRLEVMVLMSGVELPIAAIREQVASAVDLIVHQSRGRDGRRRLTEIVEVGGLESGRIQTQVLFRLVEHGDGHVSFADAVGVPVFFDRMGITGSDPIRRLFAGCPTNA
ncbi:MAG: ATPase, T2SS/T4P/T4SS family, partial [Burkholderiaceae bacterium]